MKKCWILLVLAVFLSGCGAQQTFETIADVYSDADAAQMQQVVLELPEDAAVCTIEHDTAGKLYLCDGYSVIVQTLSAGDLDRTVQELTGFSKDALMIVETVQNGTICYEFVWTAAGEGEEQIGRAAVLDDGAYHYTVSVMAEASNAGRFSDAWQGMFDSICLTDIAP